LCTFPWITYCNLIGLTMSAVTVSSVMAPPMKMTT
jgi:hypothetical protein